MSTLNPISKNYLNKVRELHTKKARLVTGLTLLESSKIINEILAIGQKIERVMATEEFWQANTSLIHKLLAARVPVNLITPKQLKIASVTKNSAGILAVVSSPIWQEEIIWQRYNLASFWGVLAIGIQDPGNLGTLVRTLAAAGGNALWLDSECAEINSPKVLRASAGVVFKYPVITGTAIPELLSKCREEQIQILAATPSQGKPYTACNLNKPTLLVLGNEGTGLSKSILQSCDQAIKIVMPGSIDSLNVTTAGAVIAFELVRQRRLFQAKKRGL